MKSSKAAKPKRSVAVTAAPAPPSHPWRYALAFFAAFCVLYEAYSPALNAPFLFDDTHLPYMLPNFYALPLIDWIRGPRPLLMLSYWLNFKESGNELTFAYHFTNLVLHFLNGALIYWAVSKFSTRILAIFAAGLFLLHPVQTESVTYVASRSETLSLTFLLAAFVVFLYRRTPAVGSVTAVAILLLFGAAVLSKEHTAVLPALLLLTDYYWNPGFSFEGIRRNWKIYVPMLLGAVLGVVVVFRYLGAGGTAGFGIKDLTWYQYFFTQCCAIWDYLRLFLLPFGQNLDYDFPISHNVLEHGAIFGLIGLLAVSVAAWIYRRKFPLASYGWFTFLILLAPTSSFVPIRDPMAERRLYLPFIGLLFIAVDFLGRWKTSRTTLVTALGVILAAEAVLTYQRNELWSSPIAIWKDTVDKSPNRVRPRFQLAFADYQAQHCEEAVVEFGKAAKIELSFDLLVDWALAYDCAGHSEDALAKLTQAASMHPNAHVYSQIGMEYGKQGKYTDALDALSTAQRLNPKFAMTYYYRGGVYEVQHNLAAAIQEYRQALAVDPYNQPARDALARLGQ